MKAAGIAFVAGLLGVLLGSLAAQAPREIVPGPLDGRVIYEGRGEIEVNRGRDTTETLPGEIRVYDHWVLAKDRGQLIPREQVVRVDTDRRGHPAEDFGDNPQPGTLPPAERPRPGTFRED